MTLDSYFPDLPTLETERLVLRKLRMDDDLDIFDYASNPEVARFVTWEPHQSIEDSREFLGFVLTLYEQHQCAPWGIVLKASGKVIGTCGMFDWNARHQRIEIGYALARDYWGQGYMPEGARAMLRYGFEQLDLNRIQAMCDVANTASARVMEKIGMSYEGTLREYMSTKGKFDSVKMYSILRSEWAGSTTHDA